MRNLPENAAVLVNEPKTRVDSVSSGNGSDAGSEELATGKASNSGLDIFLMDSRQTTAEVEEGVGPAIALSDGGHSSSWSRQATPRSMQSLSNDSLPKVTEFGIDFGDDDSQSVGSDSQVSWKTLQYLRHVHADADLFPEAARHYAELFSQDFPSRLFEFSNAQGLHLNVKGTFLHFEGHGEAAEVPRRKTRSAPP
jgi:hypothetical protein